VLNIPRLALDSTGNSNDLKSWTAYAGKGRGANVGHCKSILTSMLFPFSAESTVFLDHAYQKS
jgi:hypothetical protein